jgi:hypothetical protein
MPVVKAMPERLQTRFTFASSRAQSGLSLRSRAIRASSWLAMLVGSEAGSYAKRGETTVKDLFTDIR